MKFYLSSYRLGNNPQQLVNLIGKNKKVAIIENALDYSTDIARLNESKQREMDDFKKLGLNSEDVDLQNYFGRPKELDIKMNEFGTIWVRGGNTFILRRAFKQSGLDKWLIKQKENKDFVYAGYSAGVCILSPTLKGLETVDDPNIISVGYEKETIWDGLGLIDFAFAPHYRSDHPESKAVEAEVEYYKKKGIKFRALHDGEVIIIDQN